MKYIVIYSALLLYSIVANSQEKALMGSSPKEILALYPEIRFSGIIDSALILERPDTLYGIDGAWGYSFTDGKLEWIFFSKYIDEINKENFDKCLFAANELIKEYTKLYGKPDSVLKGNSKFRDPYKDHHWGYDVIEARWSNYKGMKAKVEFTFMGGKGEYSLLLKVNYFKKDYPYYD